MEKIVAISVIIIILLALIGVLGDYFIKRASEKKSILSSWFYFGMITYALTAFGGVFAFKHVKVSTLGVFYALTT